MPRPRPNLQSLIDIYLKGLTVTIPDSQPHNKNTLLNIKSNCGHVYKLSITNIISGKKDPYICPHCIKEDKFNKDRIPLSFFEEYAIKNNLKIINTKSFYKKWGDSIDFTCNKCNYPYSIKSLSYFEQNKKDYICANCIKQSKGLISTEELKNTIDNYKIPKCIISPMVQTNNQNIPLNFIEKFNNIKSSWNIIEYVNTKVHAKFQCNKCGYIKSTLPYNILNPKNGCISCRNIIVKEGLLSRIKEDSLKNNIIFKNIEDYKDINTILDIKCNSCGHDFQLSWARITGMKHNIHCPECYISSKRKEQNDISTFLIDLGLTIEQNNRSLISPYELDIVIPDKKVAIEYCGVMWHSTKYNKDAQYHRNKYLACKSIGITLITLYSDEWIHNLEKVKSRIKSILGLNNHIIYGRKTEIRIVDKKEADLFVSNNHIQGSNRSSQISYGCFYENMLVAVMQFSKRQGKTDSIYEYELIRFCTKADTTVIGVASKLLNKFKMDYNPRSIVTFSDNRWGSSDFYIKIGFTLDKELPVNYYYTSNELQWKRVHKFNYDKKKMFKKFKDVDLSKTETEIAESNGLYRVYDCGHTRYVIK